MTGKTGGKTEAERLRHLRQARALRENLKRRKAQARGREAASEADSARPPVSGETGRDR